MKNTYRIAHITDILTIPVEHWDEAFDDLRVAMASLDLAYAAMCEQGPMPPIAEMCEHIDFTPNGKGVITHTMNGKPFFTITSTKDEER
jgi:hypothetical protein